MTTYRRNPDGLASQLKADTLHFIGGIGNKLGSANSAGGCTLASYSGSLADYMAADGLPLLTTACPISLLQSNSGKVSLLLGADAPGAFLPAGLLVRLAFNGSDAVVYEDGVYQITASELVQIYTSTIRKITIDLPYIQTNSSAVDVYVGGAFADIAAAVADDSTNPTANDEQDYQRLMLTDLSSIVSDPLPEGSFAADSDLPTIINVERWAVYQLAAAGVFRTVDVWKHQVAASQGGMESFDRFAPFAFVGEDPTSPSREGGYDLNRKIRLVILVGQKSAADGAARIGDADTVGTAELRDIVIAALDNANPGEGLSCDDFYYVGCTEVIDGPRRHAVELIFEAQWLS
jgi:hypothetical protein